jgi:predicted nucleotidyltransferase
MISVTEHEYKIIIDILNKYVPNCEVRAFGSRYKWTARDHSDLDLAIVGDIKIDMNLLFDIKEAFQESDLVFRVDVLNWQAISPEFQKVIEAGYEVIFPTSDAEEEQRLMNAMKSLYFYETVIGKIGIVDNDGFITNLYLDSDKIPEDIEIRETELLENAGGQLLEYFSGERKVFDLELAPVGTEFQNLWVLSVEELDSFLISPVLKSKRGYSSPSQ